MEREKDGFFRFNKNWRLITESWTAKILLVRLNLVEHDNVLDGKVYWPNSRLILRNTFITD